MKTKTFITLFNVDHFSDARKFAESIENEHFEVQNLSNCETVSAYNIREEIIKRLELTDEDKNFIEVYPITDFMDGLNNQEINVDETFMCYVTGSIKPIQSDVKISGMDVLNWHGSDHGIDELADVLADILNGDYDLSLAKSEIGDY